MIQFKSKSSFSTKSLEKATKRGSNKALSRAAAYIRGVARRKVKRRKHVNSSPGQPPIAHSGVFKASILFGVDENSMAAYIGPQRLLTHRTNRAGQPVSEILEYGGMAALGMNANWIHKTAPRGITGKSGIAAYFMGLGKGPISWGRSPAEADRKLRSGERATAAKSRRSIKAGKEKRSVHPKRFSPVLGRKVYLSYVKIKTPRQAARVAQTVIDVFGYPATNRPIRIAPRPLMGPSLEESRNTVATFFQNSIT